MCMKIASGNDTQIFFLFYSYTICMAVGLGTREVDVARSCFPAHELKGLGIWLIYSYTGVTLNSAHHYANNYVSLNEFKEKFCL